MLIKELQVINFRNLKYMKAAFDTGIHVIHGGNAQGKTNLLEAIHLLVTGRSFRTTMDREMVPWARENYEATLIRAQVEKGGFEERFLLSFNSSEKHVYVNGNPIARLGDLLGRINAVLFTPSDLQLVRGAPGLRRRFLDVELSQISRSYLHHLQRYDLALRQRNALLKQHQRRPSLGDELVAWDEQLASHGGVMIATRTEMIEQLSNIASGMYGEIATGTEKLTLQYKPNPSRASGNAEQVTAQLRAALAAAHADDIRRGATGIGPHRDDFDFLIDARAARDYGSQGQQRSCVLAIKMAELTLMESSTGEPPVLLLDDLMSELDESRKRAFLQSLDSRIQTFITATEPDLVTSLVSPRSVWHMEDGHLTQDVSRS